MQRVNDTESEAMSAMVRVEASDATSFIRGDDATS
jgi:hypothetical protein